MLEPFDCKDDDINEFLKKDALMWQEKKLSTTFLFFFKEEIIGFFCCSGDSIRLGDEEKKTGKLNGKPIQDIPAIKIGRLGRDVKLKEKGIGRETFK